MKRIIHAIRNGSEIVKRQLSTGHSRFSYLDNVLDEEYGDGIVHHFPYISPEVKKKKTSIGMRKKANDFIAKVIYLGIMYALFAFYFIIQSSLRMVKFMGYKRRENY